MTQNVRTSVNSSNIDPKTRNMIMIGLALGMIIACLDGTIVSTALKTIAQDLNGMDLYSWAITAYMLCETILIPISGKLSDIYGRKPLLLVGIVLFLAGSVLAGLSTSMVELIAFRALQGLGGGTLIPVATATVADLYPPDKRGKVQGMLGAIFAIGSAIGPLLGGLITDSVGWHWCFFINVPIGIVMIALTAAKFPSINVQEKPYIDYTGIGVLSVFIADILLLFTWAGNDFAWISVETLIMVAVAVVLLFIFVKIEHRVKDPVMNPQIFKNKVMINSSVMIFVFGMTMMGVLTFITIFLQMIMGYTPTESGYITLALVAGMMITSISSGALLNRTGYRPWLVAGPVFSFIGLVMMSFLHNGSDLWFLLLSLFICGFGFGCVMSVIMILVQNNSSKTEMGMATSTINLFRNIGGTIATGLFATIISTVFVQKLNAIPGLSESGLPMNTSILNHIGEILTQFGPGYVQTIISDYGDAITLTFLVAAVLIVLVALIAVFMKTQPIVSIKGDESPENVEKEKQ